MVSPLSQRYYKAILNYIVIPHMLKFLPILPFGKVTHTWRIKIGKIFVAIRSMNH